MKCTHPYQVYRDGVWLCSSCDDIPNPGFRLGKTDLEMLKMKWYRSDKAWEDNIRSRRIIKDRHGRKRVVLVNGAGKITGEMPSA